MKDRLRNILERIKSMGIFAYLVCPLLPFLSFVCVPAVLQLLDMAIAGIAFKTLILACVVLVLYNCYLMLSAICLENDDLANRCLAIFIGQILCILIGVSVARIAGLLVGF